MRPHSLKRNILTLSLIALGSLSICAARAEGRSAWRAGAARVNITPREPIWMAGYAVRDRPSEGILQEIYAKALALEDERGRISVIVTSDLVGISRSMAEPIAAQVEKRYGIPRARLILNASHTHSAPVAGDVLHRFYSLNAEQQAVSEKYTRQLIAQIIDLVGDSVKQLAPAEVAFGQGLAGFAVNRRRAALEKRHLPGPVDHDVPVLSVRDAGKKLRAVVFGYACHATALAGYQISGDYPGFAQTEVERANPGAVALFVAGCGADANPLPRIRGAENMGKAVELAATYGKILATAVEGVLQGEMRPLDGPLKAAWQEVELPFQQLPTRAELRARLEKGEAFERRQYSYLIGLLDRDGKLPDRYSYPIQVWQFGDNGLTFIALAGEPVVDYALRFKGRYGWDKVWAAGYCNDLPAYIPSLRVLREGGYEGGEGMPIFGLPGPFSEAVEEIIAGKVDELVARAKSQK